MMDLLWENAKKYDGCLYGLEALGALRVEKGHVTAAELDGRVTIDDAGLSKMASTKKSYIGSAMRKRGVLKNDDREILVGFFPANLKKLLMLELLSVKKIILKDRVLESYLSYLFSRTWTLDWIRFCQRWLR